MLWTMLGVRSLLLPLVLSWKTMWISLSFLISQIPREVLALALHILSRPESVLWVFIRMLFWHQVLRLLEQEAFFWKEMGCYLTKLLSTLDSPSWKREVSLDCSLLSSWGRMSWPSAHSWLSLMKSFTRSYKNICSKLCCYSFWVWVDRCFIQVTGEGDDKYLIATAEQPLCAYHIDEWIPPSALPIR